MTTEEKNVQVVSRFLEEVWNQGKENVIDELYHTGGTVEGLGEDYKNGPYQFKLFHQLVTGTCSDINMTMTDVLAEGEKVSFFADMTFKHKASGKNVQLQGGGFARIINGKIVEAKNAWNFMDLLIQLGALPADALPNALIGTPNQSGER